MAEEAIFRREIAPWALLGLTLGLVEGATAAVLVKTGYRDAADPALVNLATAMVSGAPAVSNVISFAWANLAHGRARIQLMVRLQAAFAILVGLIGLAPREQSGLLFAVLSILAARMLWAGILTVRAAMWTANYPRHVLARMTGRIVVVGSLTVAASALVVSLVLDSDRFDPRWLYAMAAASGLLAAWLYRAARVRREFQLLAEENAGARRSQPFSLGMLREILRSDPDFRRYMFWMGVFGGGNLMLIAQLVVIFTDELHMAGARQIMMLAVVPLVAIPFFVPMWARLFDGVHVIEYRARQAWTLVASVALLVAGVFLTSEPLLWIGALAYGIAMAGSSLGWNLGHADFASVGRGQHYMGVHVTLTGVRGMIAPPLGMLLYGLLERWKPGSGIWSLWLPLAMTAAGAIGFNLMKSEMK